MEQGNVHEGSVILPAIALRGMVLFPGTTMHLEVGRSKSVSAVEYALEKVPIFT